MSQTHQQTATVSLPPDLFRQSVLAQTLQSSLKRNSRLVSDLLQGQISLDLLAYGLAGCLEGCSLDDRHTALGQRDLPQVHHACTTASIETINSSSIQVHTSETQCGTATFSLCCKTRLEHVHSYPYSLGYVMVDNLEACDRQ